MRFPKPRTVIFLSIVALALSLAPVARRGVAGGFDPQSSQVPDKKPPAVVHGFDVVNLDRSANACTDFNAFANGGWMKNNPVPAAYARWGKFEELAEKNQAVLHGILEEAAKNRNAKRGSLEQKLGDYYASCMDEQRIESEGLHPLDAEFQRVGALKSVQDLQAEIAHLHDVGSRSVFGFGVAQDFKNAQQQIAQASQGGISLPDRDYYTSDDEKSKQLRDAYVQHVSKMFQLAGDSADAADKEAKTVFDIEKHLAESSKTRVERRDPEANYHKMTLAELNEMTPHFDWGQYLSRRGLASVKEVNVGQPEFFKSLDKMLTGVPVEDWRTYFRWHLLNQAAPLLSSAFVQEDFNFNGKTMTGAQEQLPRWKRCVGGTDRALGEALGQFYVQKTFTPQTRERARQMVANLISVLRDDLSTISWMSDDTRKKAIAKLDAYMQKIGYPDKWRNYEALDVTRGAYIENVHRSSEFEIKRNLGKVGQPVDRTEWGMTPPTVNAYYNPSMNEIVFPAGIMQPPFYDPLADDAINYGGMGAVIGHEMTHGFDDQGARFDAAGNLIQWWTPADFKNFRSRTDCVVNQFSGYEVQPGVFEKGQLVVGESVADLGGLTIAYRAFEKSQEGKPKKMIDGFTPEQRFFLAWAQVWAGNIRPQEELNRVKTDPHPLSRFRVNGPLSNMPEFATAYSCKAGDPMVRPPDKRCQIW